MGLDTSNPENVFFVRSNAGMVFQNPDDQIVASVIENDVAFGPENLGVPTEELRARVKAALAQVGLQGFEKKQTETLSGGQKQRVAVAGVLAMEPQILVLDEASAMLDPRGRAGLMRVCRELNDAGLTIVLITHFMEEAALADRVIVLERGTVVLDGTPDDVLLQADRLTELALDIPFATRLSMKLRDLGVPVNMHADEAARTRTRHLFADGPGAARARASEKAAAPSATAPTPTAQGRRPTRIPPHRIRERLVHLRAHLASAAAKSSVAPAGKQADWGRSPSEYWALKDLSFSVRQGEFFGIAGHTGSGKSTLIQLANGLLTPNEGIVRIDGRSLADKGAATEARRDVGVVFQYPEHQLFAATVFDDVAFGPRNLGCRSEEVEARVREAMEMVHLDVDELRDRNPFELSGGQQRRVAFAGVLAMHPAHARARRARGGARPARQAEVPQPARGASPRPGPYRRRRLAQHGRSGTAVRPHPRAERGPPVRARNSRRHLRRRAEAQERRPRRADGLAPCHPPRRRGHTAPGWPVPTDEDSLASAIAATRAPSPRTRKGA